MRGLYSFGEQVVVVGRERKYREKLKDEV